MSGKPTSEDGNMQAAATQAVFTTYELIEHIILELPPADIH